MLKWQDFYKITQEHPEDHYMGWEYHVTEIATGKVVGRYGDLAYATKQAKHKFNKMQKRVEQILLK